MMNELIKTMLIFKALEVAQVYVVKQKMSWAHLLMTLLTIGHGCQMQGLSAARSAEPVQLIIGGPTGGNDETEESLSFESTRKYSEHELPSITEEDDEDDEDDLDDATVMAVVETVVSHSTKRVSFSGASIYMFAMVAGDNPSVQSGPPVQLDWAPCEQHHNVPLNELHSHDHQRSKSYPSSVRRFSAEDRIKILQEKGLSKSAIKKAEKFASASNKARHSTLSKLDKQSYHERRESFMGFLNSCRGTQGVQVEMYEPFLSTPLDLQSTRNGCAVCKACAKRSLNDNTSVTLAMYYCRGSNLCSPSSSNLRPHHLRNSVRKLPRQVSACSA
eukprot:CAMPEP_0198141376 /NCGR_PEP_ID=MMETSP1443-20131203/4401_1 /TAXON_ID=186043 /ORGANISM="Entomoneis sp., Strain CCMP2396" /LENGTH=330 /DNA_ID=CAMNT_0043804113 /DNA_START=100 /DNA_END=1092 /DNA_ORIENTATION=+